MLVCSPRASPPRTVLLSIILRAARASDSAPSRISRSCYVCQRATATNIDGTESCKSADSAQAARESRLLQASVSGRRQQRTLLYFTTLECPLVLIDRPARRDGDAAAIAIIIISVRGGSLQTARPGMCRIWEVSRPCRVLAPPFFACILDTDSPVGLLANSCECSEPYSWVAAVTTCSRRAAHKAGPLPIALTFPPSRAAIVPSQHIVPTRFNITAVSDTCTQIKLPHRICAFDGRAALLHPLRQGLTKHACRVTVENRQDTNPRLKVWQHRCWHCSPSRPRTCRPGRHSS